MKLGSATGFATLVSGEVTNLGSLTVGSSTVDIEADPNNIAGAGDTVFGQYAIGTFTRTYSGHETMPTALAARLSAED